MDTLGVLGVTRGWCSNPKAPVRACTSSFLQPEPWPRRGFSGARSSTSSIRMGHSERSDRRVAARRPRLPVVVSLHGSDVSVSERLDPWARSHAGRSSEPSAVTAPSEDLLVRAGRLGARGAREVIPYGADVMHLRARPGEGRRLRARLGVAEEATLVAGIGRFVHWKGFDYLLDAIANARSHNPDVHLVLVGDGTCERSSRRIQDH